MTILTAGLEVPTLSVGKGFVKDVKCAFVMIFGRFSRVTLRPMRASPRRVGGTTWLAAAVALLLPILAWMQYDWVTQLASADRDRRERTLRTAAAQFTAAIDTELSRLGGNLQLDGAMVERQDWDAYALRYAAATANQSPSLVRGVWYVERVRPGEGRDRGRDRRDRNRDDTGHDRRDDDADAPIRLVLRQWRPEQRTFDEVAWPADLAGVQAQLLKQAADPDHRDGGPRELMAAATALGDERTIVMPIVRVTSPRVGDRSRDRFFTDVRMRGYTVVGLALDELVATRLPALVEEHFAAAADYRVAILNRGGDRVVFESEPGAAAATLAAPDLITTFFQPRVGPMMVFARAAANGVETRVEAMPPPPLASPGDRSPETVVNVFEMRDRGGDRTMRARTVTHPHGHWLLRVQHRAGSLEAAVAASRRRNLLLSGGVLALLGVAVALIAVSARRSHALARQQMEFVAAVSHELRTPVAVIHSAAGNLADGVVGDPSRVKRYGATIQTEARRLGETVERVLQLAGLGSGRPLPMAPVSAAEIVHEAVQHTALDAERAGVDVQVEIGADLPALLGDGPSLQSAVQNLLGNAVKYAGADRWARVRVVRGGSAGTPEVHIAVDDHGPGLDAEERRHVFEPFYRGKDAVANQIQGSGLGLSLVHRIVAAHGGRVELSSEPGRGSTFTICLPASGPAAGAGATESTLGTTGVRPATT
jgi:two-component system sensor histidine kinase SenX3